MHRTRWAFVAVTATLALALAAGAASARRFNLSNQNFRITWIELEFFDRGGANLFTRCPVTLEGSFHSRTVAKVVNSLIGYITRAVVNEGACREALGFAGPARFLQETLPWHITYSGFTGVLPNILTLRVLIRGIHYEDTLGGNRCLFRGEEATIGGIFTRSGGNLTRFEFEETRTLPPLPPGICEGEAITGGLRRPSISVTLLNASTLIALTLI